MTPDQASAAFGRFRDLLTPDQIPAVMVEAAAQAVHEHDRYGAGWSRADWNGLSEVQRDNYRRAERVALAAALALCQVREEWGRDTHSGERMWLPSVEVGAPPLWMAVYRRLVITTPAEQITDTERTAKKDGGS